MNRAEIMERVAAANVSAARAMAQHDLAMTAFRVACARFDWALAEKEHRAALDHLDAYMNAVQACHRLAEAIGE